MGLLDMPSLQEIMADQRRQQAFSGLTAAGMAMMGGAPPAQGLMAGLSQIRPTSSLDTLKTYATYQQLQDAEVKREQEEQQRSARSALFAGGPQTASSQGLLGAPQDMGLMAQAYPDLMGKEMIERMYPDPPKPYSLSPGGQRFNAQNEPVASVPFKPPESKSAYQFGNILSGDDISPARQNTHTGNIEVLSGGDWTPAQGGQFISEASPFKVMPNALGRSTLVDTNTMEQVWPTPGAQPQAQGLPTQGIPEGADFSAGTGASGFFGGMANTITDALGWGLQAPDTEEAARTLDRLMTVTNLHMTAEMPGRPSNYIRERLAELEVKPGQLSQGDERSRIKMEQIRELMVMEYNRAQQVAGNPDAFSKEQVQMSSDNGGKIKELIDQYDQILGNWGGLQPGSETTIDGVPVKRIK